jgi:hypothetical protein
MQIIKNKTKNMLLDSAFTGINFQNGVVITRLPGSEKPSNDGLQIVIFGLFIHRSHFGEGGRSSVISLPHFSHTASV